MRPRGGGPTSLVVACTSPAEVRSLAVPAGLGRGLRRQGGALARVRILWSVRCSQRRVGLPRRPCRRARHSCSRSVWAVRLPVRTCRSRPSRYQFGCSPAISWPSRVYGFLPDRRDRWAMRRGRLRRCCWPPASCSSRCLLGSGAAPRPRADIASHVIGDRSLYRVPPGLEGRRDRKAWPQGTVCPWLALATGQTLGARDTARGCHWQRFGEQLPGGDAVMVGARPRPGEGPHLALSPGPWLRRGGARCGSRDCTDRT